MITNPIISSQKNRPEGRLTRFPHLVLLNSLRRIYTGEEELSIPCAGVTQIAWADKQPTRHFVWLT